MRKIEIHFCSRNILRALETAFHSAILCERSHALFEVLPDCLCGGKRKCGVFIIVFAIVLKFCRRHKFAVRINCVFPVVETTHFFFFFARQSHAKAARFFLLAIAVNQIRVFVAHDLHFCFLQKFGKRALYAFEVFVAIGMIALCV